MLCLLPLERALGQAQDSDLDGPCVCPDRAAHGDLPRLDAETPPLAVASSIHRGREQDPFSGPGEPDNRVRTAASNPTENDLLGDKHSCESQAAVNWIAANFAELQTITGTFKGRMDIEAPAWVRDALTSDGKYGFSVRTGSSSTDRRVAFTDVQITDLRSSDRYGAGIRTNARYQDVELFLSNVYIEPNWPNWDSYEATNYDGIVLDGASVIYAQSLTIRNWNADSAIDNKARVSQFVDLSVVGAGHRPLRYWEPGPHYLVDSTIRKPGSGTLIWFKDCDAATLFVYRSSFNGSPRLSDEMVRCEKGDTPNIVYLSKDPRETGEMHPMFAACEG